MDNVDLPFKSGEAAFDYICEFMDVEVDVRKPLPALVIDGREEFGLEEPVTLKLDGIQMAMLKVPSRDGGFFVVADTAGKGPKLSPGDLVAWTPMTHMKELAAQAEDTRFGWIGVIGGVLHPHFSNGSWRGKARFG